MILRFAVPADYPTLRSFREAVFRDELGVQEDTYEDVFNDHFSKNVLIEREGKLLGSVRLAFSREMQEFYISYLAVSREARCTSIARALLGAVFVLMKGNGVSVVRADAADNNLPMYLSAGCKVVGPRFRKYGFCVDWTPLRYVLGTNPDSEAKLIDRVAPHLLTSGDPSWRYVVDLRLCRNLSEYRNTLLDLIAAGGINGVVPHFERSDGLQRKFRGNWLQMRSLGPESSEQDEAAISGFTPLNGRLNNEHCIAVCRHSRFAALAVMYGCLTRRRVIYLNSWNDPVPRQLGKAKTVLLVYAPDEAPQVMASAIFRSHDFRLGIASGRDEEEASWFLLRNYFEFLGPATMSCVPNGGLGGDKATRTIEDLFCSQEAGCFGSEAAHAIVSGSDDGNLPHNAIEMLVALLKVGYTIGDAAHFASLYAKQSVVVAGDPSVRLFPFRPETKTVDGLNVTVLGSPDDELGTAVMHWFGPSDSVAPSRECIAPWQEVDSLKIASCVEARTQHFFGYRTNLGPIGRTGDRFG